MNKINIHLINKLYKMGCYSSKTEREEKKHVNSFMNTCKFFIIKRQTY